MPLVGAFFLVAPSIRYYEPAPFEQSYESKIIVAGTQVDIEIPNSDQTGQWEMRIVFSADSQGLDDIQVFLLIKYRTEADYPNDQSRGDLQCRVSKIEA